MTRNDVNLSGIWKGIFHYPRQLPPCQFDAELLENFGMISGETTEICAVGSQKGCILYALIEGQRHGREINFIKRYDDFNRSKSPVQYFGAIDEHGTEISGTWAIAGSWSGSFLMIRSRPQEVQISRVIAEVLR
ncbi:hypothetical protein [Novosphingobium sp. 9]|uniref:hypothetical protein n=1 Tax=Novosphingobium sp. 9 TaxID=2025349 RepID=UPI0021B4FCDD|nr:hypothetical protein [Novosphingobium sp. 9]